MKSKKWKITPTKQQLGIMKHYWRIFQDTTDTYWRELSTIEKRMSQKTGIKDLEFIHDSMCMGWVGIGNGERTMRLLQREELEKEIYHDTTCNCYDCRDKVSKKARD